MFTLFRVSTKKQRDTHGGVRQFTADCTCKQQRFDRVRSNVVHAAATESTQTSRLVGGGQLAVELVEDDLQGELYEAVGRHAILFDPLAAVVVEVVHGQVDSVN